MRACWSLGTGAAGLQCTLAPFGSHTDSAALRLPAQMGWPLVHSLGTFYDSPYFFRPWFAEQLFTPLLGEARSSAVPMGGRRPCIAPKVASRGRLPRSPDCLPPCPEQALGTPDLAISGIAMAIEFMVPAVLLFLRSHTQPLWASRHRRAWLAMALV